MMEQMIMQHKIPVRNDTFFCEEVSEGFSNIGEYELMEFEGNSYTNFSNVVKVTATGSKPDLGIEVGDYVLVKHMVADNILNTGAFTETLVFYTEDVLAISPEGEVSNGISDFVFLDKYVLTVPIDSLEYDKELGGTQLLENAATEYSKVFVSSEAESIYGSEGEKAFVSDEAEIVEYLPFSDYEIYINGEMYFVIAAENILTNMLEWDETMITREKDVYKSAFSDKRYVREESLLGVFVL